MNHPLLEARHLFFSYEGESSFAVQDLSLQIEEGKKIACMGSNGSGKSTFFLCCNGIRKPRKGQLLFDGHPFDYSKKGLLKLRKQVGIVFQDSDTQLFSSDVFQEIAFGPLNLGEDPQTVRRKTEAIIERLELSSFADKPVHALSGGQKKLVAIADILVMEPRLLILDEPFSSLDPLHAGLIRDMIQEISRQGVTILMATHDVDYAYSWADEILLFDEGKILQGGTPDSVFSRKDLLRQTSLEQPAVLSFFHSLCEKGILSPTLPAPRTFDEITIHLHQTCFERRPL